MNYRIKCPVCKRQIAVHGKRLTIWLHQRAGYQCPGSDRKVLLSQLRTMKKAEEGKQ